MPIDYKNYPANWKTVIRPAILARANDCCEFCKENNQKVRNRTLGFRGENDAWNEIEVSMQGDVDAEDAQNMGYKVVKIVLTIAHLDHNIQNNSYDNLAALCQRCHNRLDVHDRVKNRKETRRIKSKQLNFI